MDFNSADEQKAMGGLIPNNTQATVHVTVRPGGHGEGGWLKRSRQGDSLALDLEFTVVDGPYAKRKLWELWTVDGTSEGHAKARDISGSRIRALLESANGIRPDDESDHAKARRRIATWGDLDGLRVPVMIYIEKGGKDEKSGTEYKDKNRISEIITPDRRSWVKLEQIPRQTAMAVQPAVAAQANANGQKAARPAWAS